LLFNLEEPVILQHPRKDLKAFLVALEKNSNFCFVRFSDGEMEILRNQELEIGPDIVKTSAGKVNFSYPIYDFKNFSPERDTKFREKLIESAKYFAPGYIKGIPASSNSAIPDRDLMITFNTGVSRNLTFADLLINSNYKRFRRKFLPIFMERPNVYVVTNFRARIESNLHNWTLIPVSDNFIASYETDFNRIMAILTEVPPDSIILSSASSLSNLLGAEIWKIRQDITFLDIGTSLHDIFGLGFGIREYHQLIGKLNGRELLLRFKYKARKGYKMRW